MSIHFFLQQPLQLQQRQPRQQFQRQRRPPRLRRHPLRLRVRLRWPLRWLRLRWPRRRLRAPRSGWWSRWRGAGSGGRSSPWSWGCSWQWSCRWDRQSRWDRTGRGRSRRCRSCPSWTNPACSWSMRPSRNRCRSWSHKSCRRLQPGRNQGDRWCRWSWRCRGRSWCCRPHRSRVQRGSSRACKRSSWGADCRGGTWWGSWDICSWLSSRRTCCMPHRRCRSGTWRSWVGRRAGRRLAWGSCRSHSPCRSQN